MRTTIALDPDVAALVRREMRERGVTFKTAVNGAIRAGLRRRGVAPTPTPTFPMGEPTVSLDRALALASDLVDAETARRLALRK